jgi:hypothetical protein
MLPRILTCGAVLACGVLVLAGRPATGGDKGTKPSLSGSWGKKAGELTIEFADKDVLKIVPHGDPAVLVVLCNYTAAKEGLVKVKVTGFEGKEEVKKKVAGYIPVGLQFGFKWTVQGDAARLDDLTGKGDSIEILKSHLEGEFEKK